MEISSDIGGIILRTLSVYLVIVFLLILLGKRELSQINITDLVFILLISNAVQNAMVGTNSSLEGGLIAAGVLFALNYLFRFLNFRFGFLRKIIEGQPKLLIYDGKIQDANMHKEKITYEELMTAVREHGVSDVKHVALGMLEIDGTISIVSDDIRQKTIHKRKHRARTLLRP
jgi:uncharacterized membrane protein YcaP (DUF421 family)